MNKGRISPPKTLKTQPISDGRAIDYADLVNYNLTDELSNGTDYFLVATIDGIQYYSPNDEYWGDIIAVDRKNEVAVYTGFYEMDDMAHPHSDYAMTFHQGTLVCKFQVKDAGDKYV